jgi:uncharacterized caspase-like protein
VARSELGGDSGWPGHRPEAWATETWPSLDTPPAATGGGNNDAALIIGIEDYVYAPDIPGAKANAEAWFRYLSKTRKVPASRIILLRNGEGSKEDILDSAEMAASQVRAGGTLWVIYIGHGAPSKDGEGLLVGADARADAKSIESRSLPQSELMDALSSGRQSETVVVLDACFTGATSSGSALAEGLQPLLPSDAFRGVEATILAATQKDQFAGPLPGVKRPAFSYLVLGALRGWGDNDGDGKVTAQEATTLTPESGGSDVGW